MVISFNTTVFICWLVTLSSPVIYTSPKLEPIHDTPILFLFTMFLFNFFNPIEDNSLSVFNINTELSISLGVINLY